MWTRTTLARTHLQMKDAASQSVISQLVGSRATILRSAMVLICAVLAYRSWGLGNASPVFVLAGGVFLGGVLRDISYFVRLRKIWPFMVEVIDWKLVEKIANESDSSED